MIFLLVSSDGIYSIVWSCEAGNDKNKLRQSQQRKTLAVLPSRLLNSSDSNYCTFENVQCVQCFRHVVKSSTCIKIVVRVPSFKQFKCWSKQ